MRCVVVVGAVLVFCALPQWVFNLLIWFGVWGFCTYATCGVWRELRPRYGGLSRPAGVPVPGA